MTIKLVSYLSPGKEVGMSRRRTYGGSDSRMKYVCFGSNMMYGSEDGVHFDSIHAYNNDEDAIKSSSCAYSEYIPECNRLMTITENTANTSGYGAILYDTSRLGDSSYKFNLSSSISSLDLSSSDSLANTNMSRVPNVDEDVFIGYYNKTIATPDSYRHTIYKVEYDSGNDSILRRSIGYNLERIGYVSTYDKRMHVITNNHSNVKVDVYSLEDGQLISSGTVETGSHLGGTVGVAANGYIYLFLGSTLSSIGKRIIKVDPSTFKIIKSLSIGHGDNYEIVSIVRHGNKLRCIMHYRIDVTTYIPYFLESDLELNDYTVNSSSYFTGLPSRYFDVISNINETEWYYSNLSNDFSYRIERTSDGLNCTKCEFSDSRNLSIYSDSSYASVIKVDEGFSVL